MRHRFIILCFVLANFLLIMLAALVFLREPLTEWQNIHTALRIQESRYSLKERNLAAYPSNLNLLAEYEADMSNNLVIPYRQLAEALYGVTGLAQKHHLSETGFNIDEPITHEAGAEDGRGITEIKASARYEGAYSDMLAFIGALAESGVYYRIERLIIETGDNDETPSRVRLDIAVYGESEDGA